MSIPIIGTVWTRTKYDKQYVINLCAMLKRHIHKPCELVCITDREEEIKELPITCVWPKFVHHYPWWHFMEFYRPDIWQGRTRIYLGLDTVITGDATRIIEQAEYTLSKDFNYLIGNPNSTFADTYADCAAVIPADGISWLWNAFLECAKTPLPSVHYPIHVWVTQQLKRRNVIPLFWQDVEPSLLCSYKWPKEKHEQPREPLVFFHGEPMIHYALTFSPWIAEHWRP